MSIRVFNKPAVVIGGSSATLSSISISSNGTYSASDYSIDGFNQVTVNVSGGGNNSDFLNFFAKNYTSITLPNEIGTKLPLPDKRFYFDRTLTEVDLNKETYIPSSCFYYCEYLRSVVASRVRYIDQFGFASCYRDLKSVDFPNLEHIGYYAFQACSVLSAFPDFPNLIYIDAGAFNGVSLIKSFIFSNPNILHVGDGAFCLNSCTTIDLPTLIGLFGNSSAMWYGSKSKLTSVNIPKLPQIGTYAFSSASKLTSINMRDIICMVYASAFANAQKLEHLDNLSFAQLSGNGNFSSCYKLSSIFLPFCGDIGSSTFCNCSNLSVAVLGTRQIYTSAFYNCSSLESLYILTCSTVHLQNTSVFANTPMSNSALLGHYGSIYVPSSWVASFKTSTNWIAYSDRITAIPSEWDSRFAYAYEFYNQSSMTSIPAGKENVEFILTSAFYNTRIVNLDFPNCLCVGSYAFGICQSTRTISMPNLKYIKPYGFYEVKNLTDIYIPNCEIIDNNVFKSISTSNINMNFDNLELLSSYNFVYCSFSSFNASKLRIIRQACFSNCVNLKTISLPNLIALEGNDFVSCNKIEYVDLPNALLVRGFNGNNSIMSYWSTPKAYIITTYGLTSISSFYLDKLFSVEANCFCSVGITSLDTKNIRKIEYNAFCSCSKLTKVKLPLVSFIGVSNFQFCSNLQKALLPVLTAIGNGCFSGCSKLESVYMFANGCVLYSIYGLFQATPIINSTYLGRYGSIYVPSSMVSWYQNHSLWSTLSDRFVGLTDEEMQYIIDHWDD